MNGDFTKSMSWRKFRTTMKSLTIFSLWVACFRRLGPKLHKVENSSIIMDDDNLDHDAKADPV